MSLLDTTASFEPHEIRQAVTERIAHTSVAAAYQQVDGETWHEATEPLVPEWEPSTLAHLAFFVDDRDVFDTLQTRSSIDEEPLVSAPLTIRFLYRIRPLADSKISDWDNAGKAARHLFRQLIEDGWSGGCTVITDPRPITRIPVVSDDAVFLLCEVRVRALYHLSMAEAA